MFSWTIISVVAIFRWTLNGHVQGSSSICHCSGLLDIDLAPLQPSLTLPCFAHLFLPSCLDFRLQFVWMQLLFLLLKLYLLLVIGERQSLAFLVRWLLQWVFCQGGLTQLLFVGSFSAFVWLMKNDQKDDINKSFGKEFLYTHFRFQTMKFLTFSERTTWENENLFRTFC